MELKNKIALVTGASKGIGRATAIAFAKEGCSVAINFKSDIKSAQEVLDKCNRYSRGNILVRADVSNEKKVSEMCEKIKHEFSHLDILVNVIAPGRVATPMWGSPDAKEQEELGQVHLIKRMIQPEEIAEAIIFVVKNDAMCGEVLTVDGGMSLVTLG